jgi:acyl-coenzyme A thioesterase PaaI-like protein
MDGGGDADHGTEHSHRPTLITDGEWAGWRTWTQDAFETTAGPFYVREEGDGSFRCAFRAEDRHMNGGGFMHGGCTMTFADFCLFALSEKERPGPGVTVTLNGEFVGSARPGDRIECTGGTVKAGGSLVFVRGLIVNASQGDAPMMAFSGVIKRMKSKPA